MHLYPYPPSNKAMSELGLDVTTEFQKPDLDEYGNKLVYLGYRKEDYFCPEGYVLDIYGYCRSVKKDMFMRYLQFPIKYTIYVIIFALQHSN